MDIGTLTGTLKIEDELSGVLEKAAQSVLAGMKPAEDAVRNFNTALGESSIAGTKVITALQEQNAETLRMVQATIQGEQAVAALNRQLEIEDSLRKAGTDSSSELGQAIANEINLRDTMNQVIADTVNMASEAAAAIAAEAAEQERLMHVGGGVLGSLQQTNDELIRTAEAGAIGAKALEELAKAREVEAALAKAETDASTALGQAIVQEVEYRQQLTGIIGEQNEKRREAEQAAKQQQQSGQSANAALMGMVKNFAIATISIEGFRRGVMALVKEQTEVQRVNAQVATALRLSGDASGQTEDSVNALAESLSKLTGIDDEAIKSAEAMLLTFKNVKGEAFEKTTTAAVDLSVKMGIGLTGAVQSLGRALEDPIRGMALLRRQKITFNAEQQETIKNFVKEGEIAKAQGVILDVVAQKTAGAAAEMRDTLGGALTAAGTEWGNFKETVSGTGNLFRDVVELWVSALQWFNENWGAILSGIYQGLAALSSFLGSFADTFLGIWEKLFQGLAAVTPDEFFPYDEALEKISGFRGEVAEFADALVDSYNYSADAAAKGAEKVGEAAGKGKGDLEDFSNTAEDAKKKFAEARKAYEGFADALATPTEAHAKKIEQLNKWLKAGVVDANEYADAIRRMNEAVLKPVEDRIEAQKRINDVLRHGTHDIAERVRQEQELIDIDAQVAAQAVHLQKALRERLMTERALKTETAMLLKIDAEWAQAQADVTAAADAQQRAITEFHLGLLKAADAAKFQIEWEEKRIQAMKAGTEAMLAYEQARAVAEAEVAAKAAGTTVTGPEKKVITDNVAAMKDLEKETVNWAALLSDAVSMFDKEMGQAVGNIAAGLQKIAANTEKGFKANAEAYGQIAMGLSQAAQKQWGAKTTEGGFGGRGEGNFAAEGQMAGAIIGAFWGPVGSMIGGAIGGLVGSFVKKGADEALGKINWDETTQTFKTAITKSEHGLRTVIEDLALGINGAVQRLSDALGFTINDIPPISVKVRDGVISVVVGGVKERFKEMDQAMSFAVTQIMKQADISGLSETMRTILENTIAEDVEALAADLEFGQWYERLGLENIAVGIEDAFGQFRQLMRRAAELGLDPKPIVEQMARQLKQMRDQLLGIEVDPKEQKRRDIDAFNAQMKMIEAEQKMKIADLEFQRANLSAKIALIEGSALLDRARVETEAETLRTRAGIYKTEAGLVGATLGQMQKALDAASAAILAAENILATLPPLITEEEAQKAIDKVGGGGGGKRKADKEALEGMVEDTQKRFEQMGMGDWAKQWDELARKMEEATKLAHGNKKALEDVAKMRAQEIALLRAQVEEQYKEYLGDYGKTDFAAGIDDFIADVDAIPRAIMPNWMKELVKGRFLEEQMEETMERIEDFAPPQPGKEITDVQEQAEELRKELEALAAQGVDVTAAMEDLTQAEADRLNLIAGNLAGQALGMVEQYYGDVAGFEEMRINMEKARYHLEVANMRAQYLILAASGKVAADILKTLDIAINYLETHEPDFTGGAGDGGYGDRQQRNEERMEEMRKQAEQRQKELADAAKAAAEKMRKAGEEWTKVVMDLLDYRKELLLGEGSILSPEEQMAEAAAQYEDMFQRAIGGDIEAAKNFQSTADTFLEQLRAYGASGQGYAMGFEQVIADLDAIASLPYFQYEGEYYEAPQMDMGVTTWAPGMESAAMVAAIDRSGLASATELSQMKEEVRQSNLSLAAIKDENVKLTNMLTRYVVLAEEQAKRDRSIAA